MKYWTISLWYSKHLNSSSKELLSLQNEDYDAVIIFGQTECQFQTLLIYPNIVEITKKKNIKIYILLGSNNYSPFGYNENQLPNNLEIIYWPTFWFRRSLALFFNNNKFIYNLNDLEYNYHYIYMNGMIKKNRCLLIDNIAKNNLLKYSAYSWNNITYGNIKFNYKFDYFDGLTKKLDEQFTGLTTQWQLPKEYYESFFQVVPETSTGSQFITEKTVAPLLLGKPFIIYGAPKIHELLKKLGFELYNELFDYSFDNYENINNRINGICENIKRITRLSLDDCRQYHIKIKDKIIHNRNRAIELAYNDIPDIAQLVVKHYNETGEILDKPIIDSEILLENIKSKIFTK